jgi:hypothetical protein
MLSENPARFTIHGAIGGHKPPFPIPEMQSAFPRHAQRAGVHRRDVRRGSNSYTSLERAYVFPRAQNPVATLLPDFQ